MLRTRTTSVLAAAYAICASGAMFALHHAASHPVAQPVDVTQTCCHAATPTHPADEAPPSAPQRIPDDDGCSLCDALHATAKAAYAGTASNGHVPDACTRHVPVPSARPHAQVTNAAAQPRAPPHF